MRILTGKTALITGVTCRIGKAIAMRFIQGGANIASTDLVIDEEHGGKETERELVTLGARVKGYVGNAVDFENTAVLISQIKEDFGLIDILANNADITKDGLMLRMAEAQRDAVINVNSENAFNLIHARVSVMMRQRQGSTINTASVVGVHGNAGQANYAASKAGTIALAKSAGQETGPKGIRANATAPGLIDTAMTRALPERTRKERIDKIPLHRGGTAEDIASCALLLASDLSSCTSGQVIQVDGGMNMQSL